VVFSLSRPTAAVIERQIAAAGHLPSNVTPRLSLDSGLSHVPLPFGFAHDRLRTCLGQGELAFLAAKRAFERWAMFDLGWVRVANPHASITPGQIVAVEVHSIGLWTLNLSRVTAAVDTPGRFGFVYATTPMHVEQGEERFLLEFDAATSGVWYDLEAVSRPRHTLARLGLPVTRAFQHKFARDSHRRMREEIQTLHP
jgi:uncharacterized protein (UPF0548 family)